MFATGRYDSRGNQTSIRDPLYGHATVDPGSLRETTFAYDERGNQLSRTLPDGSMETFAYDDFGRQTLHTSFEGVVTEFEYDDQQGSNGRLINKRYFPDSTAYMNYLTDPVSNPPAETVSFTYDAFGRQVQITHDRGATQDVWSTEYDLENRVIRVESPTGDVNYEYDPVTGLRTRTFTGTSDSYAGDQVDPVNDFTYEYDVLGRLTKVTAVERNDVPLAAQEETAYDYDLVGNLDEQTAPNGIITDYVYDEVNRLERITHYLPDATPGDLSDNDKLAEFAYTIRADGKRTSATETFWFDDNADSILDPHVNVVNWTYDDAGRLTDEVFDHYDDTLDRTQHFTYDLTGNRLERTVDKANDATIDEVFSYLYDANDRLTSEQADTDNDSTVDQTTTFGYTGTQQTLKEVVDNGASQTTAKTTFAFNLQGRLSQAVVESYSAGTVASRDTITYEYDPDGIRVSALQETDADADGTFDSRTLTEYLIDRLNHTGYEQVLEETVTDADTGALIKKVVYTLGHDQISQTTFTPGGPAEGETLVFSYDGHGSTRVLTDLAAALQQMFTYDAYGQLVAIHNATGQFVSANASAALTSYLYSGEQFDSRIGQQYLRARYYDAVTGRFNRLDPFAGNNQDPQSLHKYLYTHGDPINGTDPTGKWNTISTIVAISIAIPLVSAVINYSFAAYHHSRNEMTAAFLYTILGHVDLFTAGLAALNTGTGGGAGGAVIISGGAIAIRRLVIAEAIEWAVKNGAIVGAVSAIPALTEGVLWVKAMMTASNGGDLPGNFEYDEGPGHWRSSAENLSSAKAAEFQSKVSGKPKGWIYWLGKKWDAVKVAAKELIDAKSASGNDFYARAVLDESSSLGRAFRNTGSRKAEIQNLKEMHEIAKKHGYKAVVEAETEPVKQAFLRLVEEGELTGKVIVRKR